MNKNLIIILTAVVAGFISTAYFFSHFYFAGPEITVKWPCFICRGYIAPLPTQKPLEKRQVSKIKPTGVTIDVVSQQLDMSDKDIADYIKSKSWDYSIAIRLAKSENYWNLTHSFNCSRTHTNKDGSVDVGIFQINSIHSSTLAKRGMTMEDMKDCKKNIDFAYEWVYKGSSWNAWSAYTNKSYLTHDENI